MFSQEEKEYITEFIQGNKGTIYIGCDSQKASKKYANYTVVLIVHIDNSRGCKIFGYTESERDYDKSKNKPRFRLMNEVYKAAGLYLEFGEILEDRDVEIHLDINSDKKHNSNIVFNEAFGYILGMTGIKPKMKPQAWAATHTADHLVRGKG